MPKTLGLEFEKEMENEGFYIEKFIELNIEIDDFRLQYWQKRNIVSLLSPFSYIK